MSVTMKALALKREARYQTVPELQKDIAAHQGGFATTAEHAGTFRLLWLLFRQHVLKQPLAQSVDMFWINAAPDPDDAVTAQCLQRCGELAGR